MSTKWTRSMGLGISLILMGVCFSLPALGEESPLSIKAYVFTLPLTEMQNLVKDKISQEELNLLQGKLFTAGNLFSTATPMDLKAGDNPVPLTAEKLAALQKDAKNLAVVFFFEITPAKALAENMTLKHRSYASTGEGDTAKKLGAKEGAWNLPAKAKKLRCVHFRNAGQVVHPRFVFELTAGSATYNLILEAAKK